MAMKKLLALLLALAMVFALVACEGGGGSSKDDDEKSSGNYETPLKLEMEYRNADTYKKSMDGRIGILNGLCEKEIEGIYELLGAEGAEDSFEYQLEYLEEEYGEDWEFSYELNDKEEIDKEDLEDLQEEIQEAAKAAAETLEEDKESQMEDLMYYMDLDEDEAEELFGYIEAIIEELSDVEIEEGYELDVTYITSGSELEEDEENDTTVCVYKVNGKWVSEEVIDLLLSMAEF